MIFKTILYPPEAEQPLKRMNPPLNFSDLGLDQLVERVGRTCTERWPFYTPIQDKATIEYRQAIMRDLEDLTVRQQFARLAGQLRALQSQLSAHGLEQLPYVHSRTLLSAASLYVSQLQEFTSQVSYQSINSEGLRSLWLYLRECLSDTRIVQMRRDTFELEWQLQKVRYTVLLKGERIEVGRAEGEISLDKMVEQLFDRFQQGGYGGGTSQAPAGESDVRNENAVLSLLAYEHPELFEKFLAFGRTYRDFIDQKLFQFASDIQFYLSYLDDTDRIARMGGTFCYPEITDGWDGCYAEGCFDLALAEKLADRQQLPIKNEFELRNGERIMVVTGPNQGGKTTYARMIGQMFYLASLGLRIPGSSAAIRLPDQIYTHFGKTGKDGADNLRSELLRLKDIFDHATGSSLILVNEIFASVSRNDGLYLGGQMMKHFIELGCMAVCVTFLTELAEYGSQAVSIISRLLPGECMERSYQFFRHVPDDQAHALSLAEKERLTYGQIIERLT